MLEREREREKEREREEGVVAVYLPIGPLRNKTLGWKRKPTATTSRATLMISSTGSFTIPKTG